MSSERFSKTSQKTTKSGFFPNTPVLSSENTGSRAFRGQTETPYIRLYIFRYMYIYIYYTYTNTHNTPTKSYKSELYKTIYIYYIHISVIVYIVIPSVLGNTCFPRTCGLFPNTPSLTVRNLLGKHDTLVGAAFTCKLFNIISVTSSEPRFICSLFTNIFTYIFHNLFNSFFYSYFYDLL